MLTAAASQNSQLYREETDVWYIWLGVLSTLHHAKQSCGLVPMQSVTGYVEHKQAVTSRNPLSQIIDIRHNQQVLP
jgi:hypothetical protein